MVPPSPARELRRGEEAPAEALAFLREHGANTDSFQAIARHHERLYVHGVGLVAFARVGRFTVVAGDPVAAPGRLPELVESLRRTRRGPVAVVSASGAVRDELAAEGWGWLKVGEEPFWEPNRWTLDGSAMAKVRHAVTAARKRGITVSQSGPRHDGWERDLREMEAVGAAWAKRHAIGQLGFLLTLAPFEDPAERKYFVARDSAGACVAFLAAVPIYARQGWYFQDFVRQPDAPNGTVELLVHGAMEALRDQGARLVTLGAAPLAGLDKEQPPLRWLHRSLRFAYDHLDAFYPFQSLTEYKAKFSPHWWEPKYLVFAPRWIRARLFFSVLKAYDERGASRIVLAKLTSAMRQELALDPATGRPRVVGHALAVPSFLLSQDLVVAGVLALGIGSAIGMVSDHLRRHFDEIHVALAAAIPAALLTVAVLRAKDRYEEGRE
jgi:phosphatidylglycerol lysyltransferase